MGYPIVASNHQIRSNPRTRPAVEGFDGVGAGEEEPVEAVELGERGIERGEGSGVDYFDGGDEDGLGAKRAEVLGQG